MIRATLLIITLGVGVYSCTNTRNSAENAGIRTYDHIVRDNTASISENLRKSCQEGYDLTHVNGLPLETSEMICTFYQQNDYTPVWTNGDTLTGQAEALIDILKSSRAFGLESHFYHAGVLASFQDSLKSIPDADPRHSSIGYTSELLLTNAYFLFATHVSHGYMDSLSLSYVYKKDSMGEGLSARLIEGIINNNVVKSLLAFEPQHPEYQRLRKGLTYFVEHFSITSDTFNITDYKEDSASTYNEAKKALIRYGFADNTILQDDSAFITALKGFQAWHGLNQDGKIGRYTAYALNRSNEDRYRHAAASLERWRWEDDLGSDHIFVNVAGYKLYLVEDNEITREHRTIVGAPKTKTPSFSADLQYINVNPFWHVPYSITSKEILPQVQKDPEYLEKHGYQVFTTDRNPVDASTVDWSSYNQHNFPYRIRQNSGWGNSLGRIAFMFPNRHAVFIHDTPAKVFFKNDVRDYSHGCVRLEDPVDLANHILEKDINQNNADSVQAFLNRGVQRRIVLNKPIRVHIRYMTAMGNSEGKPVFLKDVYGRDTALIKAMFRSTQSPAL